MTTDATQRATRATTFAVHQLTLLFGILTLPLALAARRAGVVLPIRRLVEWANETYDRHASE
ncbi:MAG: hypothetical protein ABEH80_04420 [Halobaculum sp.]|jgi:hypothetical protein